jgi:hypothetical protein
MTDGSIFLDKDFTQKPPTEHLASLMAILFSRYQKLMVVKFYTICLLDFVKSQSLLLSLFEENSFSSRLK